MKEETYMGEKDISEKILINYNDVFADIINVCAFDGKEMVKPEDLENASVHAQYKEDKGILHEEERDVVKYWKNKSARIVIYGIENQTEEDKDMPFRIIGYDGASYRAQLLEQDKNIVPVVSFVLYFGTDKRWKTPRNIKKLMKIPEGLDEFVNDYIIHVIEVAWITDEQLKMFKSDFGIVADFFVQRRKNKNYIPNDQREFQHVDAVLKLLTVMTGDRRYEKISHGTSGSKKGGIKTMCEVADRLNKMGTEDERRRIIRAKMEKGQTLDQIADALELSLDEVKEIVKTIQVEKE